MSVKEILESYELITINKEIVDGIIIFSIAEKQFLFVPPFEENPASMANIFLYNDDGLDIPHIMLKEETFPGFSDLPNGKYRAICLYEQESIVGSIMSYESKIRDALERLIRLLSMSESDKEHEFRKEFMFYWNSNLVSQKKYSVYLGQDQSFTELETYFGDNEVRLIEKGLLLSDIDKRNKKDRIWMHHVEHDVFYIPISDPREILPPHRGYSWNAEVVRNIVYSRQINHIADETFQKIKNTYPKSNNVIVVFGMQIERLRIVFAAKVKCKNISKHSLFEKIVEDIVDVSPLFTVRKDYDFLCEQIGNECGLWNNKILIIGAGSLGSYVTFELAKNGASNLKIYDGDTLEDENILRWAYGGIGIGTHKATALSFLVNLIHPEIKAEGINRNIDESALIEELSRVAMIVITVGSSDEQLKFNRILRRNRCSIPVFYVWLEEGGINSHILYVDYQKKGCFECLYTDEKHNFVNNRARKNDDSIQDHAIIHNGCGGTRAAYGTAILLRTTAALLDIIREITENKILLSTLFDISPYSVSISNIRFPMEACNCCGNS